MRSTKVLRLGAFISASALALSLGTVPSSAADESTQSFGTKSAAPEGPRDGRLATGADLRDASSNTSRSSASAVTAAAAANVVKIPAHSARLNDPVYNYIDIDDFYVSNSTNVDSIEFFELKLSVDGVSKGYFPVYWDESEEVYFIEIPGNIGLGKSLFTATRVNYTEDWGLAPTVDGTNSNYFYVRRDVWVDYFDYQLSGSSTKTFNIEGMQIYSPSLGGFTGLSKIKLQYKTSSGWKTKKTIYLDDDGNGSYTFSRSTKFYYRLVYGMTSTFIGFKATTSVKI